MKAIKTKRNWSEYNQKLKSCARIELYIHRDIYKNWYYVGKRSRGGKLIYSDTVIEMCLTIREYFKMPLRQSEGFLLVILAPFMVIVALLIKTNDGGSVFYSQKRTGYNGKVFEILKFRSMKENAEENGVQWASANDSRITKIGKFIRQTRIDELPQLINILKNDMSIVGPRPERPEFVVELSKDILYYNERHRIKPGLTGWAQINGGYAASINDAKEKLEYDLYYLKYCNPSLDLLIVLKTISVVLWPNKVH